MKGDLSNLKIHETYFNFYLWNKKSHRKIKLVKRSFDCWECVSHAKDNEGYPKTRLNYGTYRIFRVMYGLFKNNKNYYIPKNKVIRHVCHNRLCCNPNHLIIGSHKENMNDLKEKNEINKFNESNLSEMDIAYILESSMDNEYLALLFNVSCNTIYNIKSKLSKE